MNREVNKEEKKLSNVATAGIMIAAFLLLWSLARNAFPVYHRVSPWSVFETIKLSPSSYQDPNMIVDFVIPDKNDAFRNGTSVEARVLRVFPGEYMKSPTDSYRYHVMELLVVDVIAGKNIPRIVYCAFLSEWSADLKPFQSFVIALKQLGLGRYNFINAEKKIVETFGNMYFADYNCVIPIKNGKIDEEFRKETGWGVYVCSCKLASDPYPGHSGRSLSEIKNSIRNLAAYPTAESNLMDYNIVSVGDMTTWRAKFLYRYVSSPTIGVFYQSRGVGGTHEGVISFSRWIGNEYSGETIEFYITDGKIVDAEYRGTKWNRWFSLFL